LERFLTSSMVKYRLSCVPSQTMVKGINLENE
jgi:hypothetical protein